MLCGHVQTATSQDILEILQRNAASTNKSTKKNGVQNYATAVVSAEIYAKAIPSIFFGS
jgi:hypothetical protein